MQVTLDFLLFYSKFCNRNVWTKTGFRIHNNKELELEHCVAKKEMILKEDETVTKSENNNPSQPRNESKDSTRKLVPKDTFYNNLTLKKIAKSKLKKDFSSITLKVSSID
jgi:hypothetical protein